MGEGWRFMTQRMQRDQHITVSRFCGGLLIGAVRGEQEFQIHIDNDNLWSLLEPLLELADELEGNPRVDRGPNDPYPGQASLPF